MRVQIGDREGYPQWYGDLICWWKNIWGPCIP